MAKKAKQNGNGANLGFEEKLWAAADKLRGHMDAAEYKHVVLGLIFLKYISDAFQERYDQLKQDKFSDPEDRDEYAAENVFWVPKQARWDQLQAKAKQPPIGKLLDDAMFDVETYLAGKIADRLSRMENTAFITGNGIMKPRGGVFKT